MNSYADSLTVLYIAAADRRHRRRRGLRHLRRQRPEVVPRPSRPCGRTDRRGLRRRRGAHRHPDPEDDRPAATRRRSSGSASARASSCVVLSLTAARTASRPGADRAARGAAVGAQLHALEMLRSPIFWLHVPHVRAGRRRRADGDRAARADRQRLRSPTCRSASVGSTLPALTFALSIDRILNGIDAAVLRLGVRPHRPREHDVIAFGLEAVGILGAERTRP